MENDTREITTQKTTVAQAEKVVFLHVCFLRHTIVAFVESVLILLVSVGVILVFDAAVGRRKEEGRCRISLPCPGKRVVSAGGGGTLL